MFLPQLQSLNDKLSVFRKILILLLFSIVAKCKQKQKSLDFFFTKQDKF